MAENFIKEFWENQEVMFKDSHWASWGDSYAIDLEIKNIANYIKQEDKILDIGCANGFSTFYHYNKASEITGVDFSEQMIEQAKEKKTELKLDNRINFFHGDVRNLDFKDNTFDVVYTTRVLINLPSWKEQQNGIKECLRVTKKGGTVILSEGFWEPLMLLNSLRGIKNLPPLEEHDFNRYLKKYKTESFLKKLNLNFEIIDFTSIYYLGSRFLREIVTNPSDYPGYSNPINKIFYEIEQQFSGGGFGIQQAVVIKK